MVEWQTLDAKELGDLGNAYGTKNGSYLAADDNAACRYGREIGNGSRVDTMRFATK